MQQFSVIVVLVGIADAFFSSPAFLSSGQRQNLVLFSGYGIATNYTWKEEAFEIELTVRVPQSISSKDVRFKTTPTSIDLGYCSSAAETKDSVVQLLDPTRPLRGRVNLDGTYWMLGDDDADTETRLLTVTIDKYLKTPSSDFEAVEFDWKGIYRDDDAEVSKRHYDVPEPLNVRDYAGRLGVDIDNMNMSMVDKTMFSSGLNMSQSALEEMQEAGYVSEEQITQQKDGLEFMTDDSGDAVPYSLEKDLLVEPQEAADANDDGKPKIHQQVRNFTRAAFAQDAAVSPPSPYQKGGDPILELSVEKMREVLRSQGLAADGSEQELRDRLRTQVNTLLQKGSV